MEPLDSENERGFKEMSRLIQRHLGWWVAAAAFLCIVCATALIVASRRPSPPSWYESRTLADLLAMREARRMKVSGQYLINPLLIMRETTVRKADCWVQCVVEEVTVDKDPLVAMLSTPVSRGGNDGPDPSLGRLDLKVRLRLVESYPPIADRSITISASGEIEHVPVGQAFLLGLDGVNGTRWRLSGWFQGSLLDGTYRIEGEGLQAKVSGLVIAPNTMSVGDAWQLIRAAYDQPGVTADHDDANDDE